MWFIYLQFTSIYLHQCRHPSVFEPMANVPLSLWVWVDISAEAHHLWLQIAPISEGGLEKNLWLPQCWNRPLQDSQFKNSSWNVYLPPAKQHGKTKNNGRCLMPARPPTEVSTWDWVESTAARPTVSNWYPLQMDKDQVLALRISPYIMNLLHQFYEICPISSNKSQHLNNLRSDPPCLGSSVRTCLPIVGIQWVLPSFLKPVIQNAPNAPGLESWWRNGLKKTLYIHVHSQIVSTCSIHLVSWR